MVDLNDCRLVGRRRFDRCLFRPPLFCRLLNPGHGGYLSVESFPLLWKSAVADADRSGLMALPCSRSAEEDIAELTELAGALL